MPAYDDGRFDPPAPIAMVVVRNPETGESVSDVPMLIDSGADATLLPKSAVESLGITGTGERYQLMAFDGTTSDSEVVRVHLVFMNKTFRGRYLLIDGEVGVIGRDVLNHVRLLLDGPARNWEEWPPTA
jgi:hypothetical protein